MFFVITFYVSLVAMIILIVLKVLEIKRGKRIAHETLSFLDHSLKGVAFQGKSEIENLKVKANEFVKADLPRFGIAVLSRIRNKIALKYKQYQETSRGTRILSGENKASDYLVKIAEEKKNGHNEPRQEVE